MQQGLLSEVSDPRGRRSSTGNLLEDPDAAGDDTVHLNQAPPGHRLGTCRKLSFAIGGVPNPITSIVTTFYLSPFLLEVARVRPATVGIIVLVGRVLDAFTDPLVGALSDHTKSRLGRRRPWMFFSIVPFACSFGALFWTWDIVEVQLSSNATT
jgi:Na+/melibiose symporter-like transporter